MTRQFGEQLRVPCANTGPQWSLVRCPEGEITVYTADEGLYKVEIAVQCFSVSCASVRRIFWEFSSLKLFFFFDISVTFSLI